MVVGKVLGHSLTRAASLPNGVPGSHGNVTRTGFRRRRWKGGRGKGIAAGRWITMVEWLGSKKRSRGYCPRRSAMTHPPQGLEYLPGGGKVPVSARGRRNVRLGSPPSPPWPLTLMAGPWTAGPGSLGAVWVASRHGRDTSPEGVLHPRCRRHGSRRALLCRGLRCVGRLQLCGVERGHGDRRHSRITPWRRRHRDRDRVGLRGR